GVCCHEPLYVDLRWARTVDELSLRHSQFRGAVLDIAAALHDKPKDDLDGADVRQYRRTRRFAGAAILLIFLFAIAAALMATVATQQRNVAEHRGRIALSRQL